MQMACFEYPFVSLVLETLKIPLIIEYLLANVLHITLGAGKCFGVAINFKEEQKRLVLS